MSNVRLPLALLILTVVGGVNPALARPGEWGPGWGSESNWGPGGSSISRRNIPDSREGKVDVARFVAPDVDVGALGHGRIGVGEMPGDTSIDSLQSASFEAAVIDQLAKAGYDTAVPDLTGGHLAEVRMIRNVVTPQEPPHKPVSGETTIGASNHGSYAGMAIAVDLTKPAKALISTRLMVRIVDRASGKGLWEGRADIITREGDARWTDQAIATRLAAALFQNFPSAT
jgi:hypothetical protein